MVYFIILMFCLVHGETQMDNIDPNNMDIPLISNLEAPLKATLDISQLNKQLTALIDIKVKEGVEKAMENLIETKVENHLQLTQENLKTWNNQTLTAMLNSQRGPARLISFNKTVTQSTYWKSIYCNPANAVDGLKNRNIASTDWEREPFMWIDLQDIFTIKTIVVYNRFDCCGDRLKNLHIYVGMTVNRTEMALCSEEFKGPSVLGQIIRFDCLNLPMGNKVLLIQHADGTDQLMNFTEVEVYGF